jgi:hypothetical protein
VFSELRLAKTYEICGQCGTFVLGRRYFCCGGGELGDMVADPQDYGAKALACEQIAKKTADRTIRLQWEELAMQWHLMANQAARLLGEAPTPVDASNGRT